MANELWHSYDSSKTLYALVYRVSDGYIYDVGDGAFEAIGTWNDARVGECDIALVATSDIHFGDFPVVDADVYYVQIRERAGGSPDVDDEPVAQGVMHWDGTAEINVSTLDALLDELVLNDSTILYVENKPARDNAIPVIII